MRNRYAHNGAIGQTSDAELLPCRWDALECVGSLTHKISVHANDDVYKSTKQRMAALESEVKKSWYVSAELCAVLKILN